jgi:hypothetical protein
MFLPTHYLKLSYVVPKFFFFFFLHPLRSNIIPSLLSSSLSFLFVPSPSYLPSCVPVCASFPDPTFFVHLPFSLSFSHLRCLCFHHTLFLPLLKNLHWTPSTIIYLYPTFTFAPSFFSSFAMSLSFFYISRSCFVRSLSRNIFFVSFLSLSVSFCFIPFFPIPLFGFH